MLQAGEAEVTLSMQLQEKWIRKMQPDDWMTSLRWPFSLSKQNLTFSYLDGTIVRVPFAKTRSPEIRIQGHARHAKSHSVQHNIIDIEQKMFYFNTEQRGLKYESLADDEVFNKSYDTEYFLYAIYLYTNCREAIVRPLDVKGIIAYAKRVYYSLV
jgi:hypothetical protein